MPGGDYDSQIEKRIEKLETHVASLINWRNWMLGFVGGMGIMTGAFAKQVAEVLRQMLGG